MSDLSVYLPHESPAIMLQEFEPWAEHGEAGLKGRVRLDQCALLWMTDQGLPVSFGIEILGQLSAVYLRRKDTDDTLLGGRLAVVDRFLPKVAYLPVAESIEARLIHVGGSSAGYHKFSGELVASNETVLATADFSVLAFFKK